MKQSFWIVVWILFLIYLWAKTLSAKDDLISGVVFTNITIAFIGLTIVKTLEKNQPND